MSLLQDFRKDVIRILSKQVPKKEIEKVLERPPENIGSDMAYPCFVLAKRKKRDPAQIARDISKKLKPSGLVGQVSFYGPYINFLVNWNKASPALLKEIIRLGEKFGKGKPLKKNVMVKILIRPFFEPGTAP